MKFRRIAGAVLLVLGGLLVLSGLDGSKDGKTAIAYGMWIAMAGGLTYPWKRS